jgi:hypothetical protein
MLLDFLQVNAYMFGSVPLRTYLPDGDIDLSVFCAQDVAQPIRDTWAMRLQGVIEQEQSSGTGPYKIGDITVINAEVSNRRSSTPCWTCKQLLPEQQGSETMCPYGCASNSMQTQGKCTTLLQHGKCCRCELALRRVAFIRLAAAQPEAATLQSHSMPVDPAALGFKKIGV